MKFSTKLCSLSYHTLSMLLTCYTIPRRSHCLLHTSHATLCSFSSRQQRLSFDRICSHRTVPTSIRSTTGYEPSSSSECVSHR